MVGTIPVSVEQKTTGRTTFCSGHSFADGNSAELWARERGHYAAELADRRAGHAHDDGILNFNTSRVEGGFFREGTGRGREGSSSGADSTDDRSKTHGRKRLGVLVTGRTNKAGQPF